MRSGKPGTKWGAWTWREDCQRWHRQRVDRRGVYQEEWNDGAGNSVSMQQPDVSAIEQGLEATSLTAEPPASTPESGDYGYGPSLGTGYGQPSTSEPYGATLVDTLYSTSPSQPPTTHLQSSTYGSGYVKQTKPSAHKSTGKGRGVQPHGPFYSSAVSGVQLAPNQLPESLSQYPSSSHPGGQAAAEQSPESLIEYTSYHEGAGDATPSESSTPSSTYATQPAYSLGGEYDTGGQGWTQSPYGQTHLPHQKTKSTKPPKHHGQDTYGVQPNRRDQFATTEPVIASTQETYPSGYGDPGYGQPEPNQQAALEEATTTGYGADFPSSTPSGEFTPASTYHSGDDLYYGQDAYGAYGGSYDPYQTYPSAYQPPGEEDRARTPTQKPPKQDIPKGPRLGSQSEAPEELDVRFIVEPSWRFETGKVFKILWSEPIGATGQAASSSENKIQRDQWGDHFYICFRRFIVAKSDEGHSTCVPILTYEGRACTKKGVKTAVHGIVHALGTRPQPLKNEPKLGFPAVRLTLEAEGEKLAHTSRINYSKFQTIEHNMKVFFIGKLVHQDLEIFMDAVESCWKRKKGGSKHGQSHRHK